jgi:hypothetical protein
MVKKEDAGGWEKDILCWEAWEGADDMVWTKGSSCGHDAMLVDGNLRQHTRRRLSALVSG